MKDSMIKNRIEHPDLKFYNYKKIKDILNNADEIVEGRKNHLRFFKQIDTKFCEVVLKTTQDKKENFLISFHIIDEVKLRNMKR